MWRKRTLTNLVVVLGVLVAVLAPLYVVFARAREKADQSTCQSNLKMLSVTTEMYAQQHGGHLPSAADWWRATGELKGTRERCLDDRSSQESSYALSPRWSGAILKDMPNPAHSVLLYEVDFGRPAYRHRGGMNVAYADRHVEWIKQLPPGALAGP